MRRKDREVTDAAKIDAIIMNCDCCRLGFIDGAGTYILPLNFGYTHENGIRTFYFHGAKEGKKIKLITEQPHVGFELDGHHALHTAEMAPAFSFRFQSIIGQGDIRFVRDKSEKKRAMELLMKHYTGKDDWELPDAALEKAAVMCLTVTELSCKEHE
jgi:nitroimidazol reductase NimA-like FMN-containing flavoprotein (pyridoxamine 5'-phosphate oxidase superfamily)